MSAPPNERGLLLLLEEYFTAEDERFLETLRKIHSAPSLAALADRWKKDPRPWARQQIFSYLGLPLNCPGHQPLIKHLFKQAEANKDDEVMAAFLLAFDKLVRRERDKIWRWDPATRRSWEDEILTTPRDTMELDRTDAFSKQRRDPGRSHRTWPVGSKLFSYHTRYYLRRRAWRYFRRLGFQRPEAYPKAIASALLRYRDEDLAKGEHILDSWGLIHACFGKHDALEFGTSHVALKENHSLAELTPSPFFLQAWQAPAAADVLFGLAWQARSHLMRVWAIQLLCREHRSLSASPEHLFRLLEHDDPEVQQFGAQVLDGVSTLDTMPVSFWLRLLQTQNPEALQKVCDVFAKRVSPERLDLVQCMNLACHQAVPVARLGLQFLNGHAVTTAPERQAVVAVVAAKCAAVAHALAQWALNILGKPAVYDREVITRFFDSRLPEIRAAAWEWLVADSAGYNDTVLWSRLTETPYDDLRLCLVEHLEKRSESPAPKVSELAPVWCSVLLGVHRGGRQKLKAVRQLGEAIQNNPSQIEQLLPVLAVAVRSVRAPEARAGLSAVVSAVEAQPNLAGLVRRFLPELELSSAEVPS